MNIAEQYVNGLKEAYYNNGLQEEWDQFEQVKQGVSPEDLQNLLACYPDTPQSLLHLLGYADGTYWRAYAGQSIALFFLGSDLEEYPYYLLSARQMIEEKDGFATWGDFLITREYDDIPVDPGICDSMDQLCLLHFSDCMNNGGTSQLFIDFSPSPAGKKGQILRYLHDPDELAVIAGSFDEYLQMLMETGYDFIKNEEPED